MLQLPTSTATTARAGAVPAAARSAPSNILERRRRRQRQPLVFAEDPGNFQWQYPGRECLSRRHAPRSQSLAASGARACRPAVPDQPAALAASAGQPVPVPLQVLVLRVRLPPPVPGGDRRGRKATWVVARQYVFRPCAPCFKRHAPGSVTRPGCSHRPRRQTKHAAAPHRRVPPHCSWLQGACHDGLLTTAPASHRPRGRWRHSSAAPLAEAPSLPDRDVLCQPCPPSQAAGAHRPRQKMR